MREADVGSPSADTDRAISDHRISRPSLIWPRGSQPLMGNLEGSNRSSRWHWHQPRKGRCSDTDDPSFNLPAGDFSAFKKKHLREKAATGLDGPQICDVGARGKAAVARRWTEDRGARR